MTSQQIDKGFSSMDGNVTMYDILIQTLASYDDSNGVSELESGLSDDGVVNEGNLMFVSSH